MNAIESVVYRMEYTERMLEVISAKHHPETSATPITLPLADDSEITRRAIRRLLHKDPEIGVVGEAKNFSEAIRMTCNLKSQIILMDLRMSEEEDGTPLRVKSHLRTPGSQLLAISVWSDEDTTALANRFGALTLLDKMKLSADFLLAIKNFANKRPKPANFRRTEALEA
jgi:DNA-binding NarL/FixJ family response regulator